MPTMRVLLGSALAALTFASGSCGGGGGSGGGSSTKFDVVAGQRDLDTVLVYYDVFSGDGTQPPSVTLDAGGSGIDQPRALLVARNRLLVGNVGNDTIGIFQDFLNLVDGQAPDVVLDFAGSGIKKPKQLWVTDDDDLIALSSDNDSIRIWRNFTTVVSGQAPDVVLDGVGSGLDNPSGIAVWSGDLFVGDTGDDEVLVFRDISTLSSGDAPDIVLNIGVSSPQKVLVAGNILYVMQPYGSGGSKVVVFGSADSVVNNQPPDATLDVGGSLLDSANTAVRIGNSLYVGNRRLGTETAGPSVLRFDGADSLVDGEAPDAFIDGSVGVPATDQIVAESGRLFIAVAHHADGNPLGGVAIYRNPRDADLPNAPDLLLGNALLLQRTVGLAVNVR